MGRFVTLVYSGGHWSDERASDDFLSIDIHDSDFATVDYRPAMGGSGRFYLGYEPREYFNDPNASAPVDRSRELLGITGWASKVLGRELAPEAVAPLLATPGTEPENTFVEETVGEFLRVFGLPLPSAFAHSADPTPGSSEEPSPGPLEGVTEKEIRARLELPT